MREQLDQYALIDRYLNNQLSDTERLAFTEQINADDALLEEVNQQRAINELIFDQGLLDIKLKLKAIDSGSKSSGNSGKWMFYSAGVLVLLAVSLVIFKSQQPPASTSQFDAPTQFQAPRHQQEMITPPKQPHSQEAIEKNVITTPPTQNATPTTEKNETLVPSGAFVTDNDATTPSEENTPPAATAMSEDVKKHCQLSLSSLIISVSESCPDAPTGKLSIDKSSSLQGTPPYQFSINGKNYFNDFVFNHLYAGTYRITISDADGCIWQDPREITIGEKDCRVVEYSFYPDRGETWTFPMEPNTTGKIEIYNKQGRLVYSSPIMNGEPVSWDGRVNGESLPMGVYQFMIQDGHQARTGSVTIFR